MSKKVFFEKSGIRILNPHKKLEELAARNKLSNAELAKLLEKVADTFAPQITVAEEWAKNPDAIYGMAIIIFTEIDDGIYISFGGYDNKKDNQLRVLDLFPPNKRDTEQNTLQIQDVSDAATAENSEDDDMQITPLVPQDMTSTEYAQRERVTLDENDIPPGKTKRFIQYLNRHFQFRIQADKDRALDKDYFDVEIQRIPLQESYIEFLFFIYPDRVALECVINDSVYEIE